MRPVLAAQQRFCGHDEEAGQGDEDSCAMTTAAVVKRCRLSRAPSVERLL